MSNLFTPSPPYTSIGVGDTVYDITKVGGVHITRTCTVISVTDNEITLLASDKSIKYHKSQYDSMFFTILEKAYNKAASMN